MNECDTVTCFFGSLNCFEITVPADMVACSGPWDDAAAYYGPELSQLNPDIDMNVLRREMGEFGSEPEKYDEDDALWEHVAWMIACDRMEEAE